MTWRSRVLSWTALAVIGAAAPAQARPGGSSDDRLAAARRFVEASDRYLHHSKLRRGMEGYGLTVLAGTKIVKFQAKVVSVVTRWGPHQDVILAMLSGQNLEHTGIIAGMSGSPVYFPDPDDGKAKLVGAIAYGWQGQKDPLCGIQPITQMLAAGEAFKKLGKGAKAKSVRSRPPSAGTLRLGPGGLESYLQTILNPEKIDFVKAFLPASRSAARRGTAGPELVPLTTPLMVSGARPRTLAELTRFLEPMGIVPVASGGVNAAEAAAIKDLKLVPGAGIAVSMATGDAEYTAVGTVTEVVNGRLLAFGHSFYGEGDVKLPIGPAYVHTSVAGLFRSFKLSSGLHVTGTLVRDEQVAVSGVIGPKPAMIPMTVTCHWPGDNRRETFQYRIVNHRLMTAMMARFMLVDAAAAWHEPPERHTVKYSVAVAYDKMGTYRAQNASSGNDIYAAISDLGRPITALLNNPYGERVAPRRIDVTLTVEKGDLSASMLDLKLRGQTYRPGETVAGTLTVRPYRKPRKTIEIQFKLPEDMPEGNYTLTVCDASGEMRAQQSETPHRFAPRTTRQIFEAIQRLVEPPQVQLYLRVPVRSGGGLAIAQSELPDLPESRAKILSEARILDTRTFRRSLVQTLKSDYIVSGSLGAKFRVQKEPGETLLRK
jgi:hypothetical protein